MDNITDVNSIANTYKKYGRISVSDDRLRQMIATMINKKIKDKWTTKL